MLKPKCPECGGERFLAHQVVHMEVHVDGNVEFLENVSEMAEDGIYHADKPFGPYACVGCGNAFDSLEEMKERQRQAQEGQALRGVPDGSRQQGHWVLRVPAKPGGPMFITDEQDRVVCVFGKVEGCGEFSFEERMRNADRICRSGRETH